jgi:hypothetical protein
MGILRQELNKLGIEHVWVGLIDGTQRSGMRAWKTRNKDRTDILVMNMLTTYQTSTKYGLLATCNMIPNSSRQLRRMTVHEAVTVYEGWGLKYRPNRVTSDWELVHPGKRHGKFLGTKETIQQVQYLLNERHGYKPGERPEDPYLYESRLYEALRIVLERQTRSDDDMYS